VRKARDLTGQDGVGGGDPPVSVGLVLDNAVACAVLLGRLSTTQEVRGMRDRRAPVVREALERREREPFEILPCDGQQPGVAERVQQEFNLCRTKRVAQVNAQHARAHATSREGAFELNFLTKHCREAMLQMWWQRID